MMTMPTTTTSLSLSSSSSTNRIKNCQHNSNNNNNHDDHQDKINSNIRWLESSPSSPFSSSSSSSSSVDNNNKQKGQIAYEYINFSSDNIDDDKTSTKTTTVLFCNGYQSSSLIDGGGRKVQTIKRYCMDHKISFCSFDYRGHGMSSTGGNITDFTTSDWINDACQILETIILKNQSISKNKKTTHQEEEENQSEESKQQQQQQKEDRTNSNNNNNNNRIILVGSSMGVTIALHLAMMMYPTSCSISGILGIASAPDFFQDLYYNNNANVGDSSSSLKLINVKQQQQQQQQDDDDDHDENNNMFYLLQTEYNVDPYIIPWKLIQDAKENWNLLYYDYNNDNNTTTPKNKKMKKKIPIKCPIYLIHGQCDKDVSWQKTMELSNQLESTQVNTILIKDGDHRLSRKEDLDIICKSLESLLIQAC